MDYKLNEANETLTIIEKENVREGAKVRIVIIDLKTGNRSEAFTNK